MKKTLILTGVLVGTFFSTHARECKYEKLATTAFENIPLTLPKAESIQLEAGSLAMRALESAVLKLPSDEKDQEDINHLRAFFAHTSYYLSFLNQLNRQHEAIASQLAPLVSKLQIDLKEEIEKVSQSEKDDSVKKHLKTVQETLDKELSLVALENGLTLQANQQPIELSLGKSINDQQMKSLVKTIQIIIPLIKNIFKNLRQQEQLKNMVGLITFLEQSIILRLRSFTEIGHFFSKNAKNEPSGILRLYELDKKYAKTLLRLILEEFKSLSDEPDISAPVKEKIEGLIIEFTEKKTLLSSEIVNELRIHGIDVSSIQEAPKCIPGHDYSSHADDCPCKQAMTN